MENLKNKTQIIKETEKAVLVISLSCDNNYPDTQIWLPKSQIIIENKYVVAIKEWLADKICRENYSSNIYSFEAEKRFEKYLEKFEK